MISASDESVLPDNKGKAKEFLDSLSIPLPRDKYNDELYVFYFLDAPINSNNMNTYTDLDEAFPTRLKKHSVMQEGEVFWGEYRDTGEVLEEWDVVQVFYEVDDYSAGYNAFTNLRRKLERDGYKFFNESELGETEDTKYRSKNLGHFTAIKGNQLIYVKAALNNWDDGIYSIEIYVNK